MAARRKSAKPVTPALIAAMKGRAALVTALDSNPIVRQRLVERLTTVISHKGIPIAVLHLVAQVLEEYR